MAEQQQGQSGDEYEPVALRRPSGPSASGQTGGKNSLAPPSAVALLLSGQVPPDAEPYLNVPAKAKRKPAAPLKEPRKRRAHANASCERMVSGRCLLTHGANRVCTQVSNVVSAKVSQRRNSAPMIEADLFHRSQMLARVCCGRRLRVLQLTQRAVHLALRRARVSGVLPARADPG